MKVVLSFVSIVTGALGGAGVLVLLQQQGAVYPTRTVAIVALLLGVLWGVALPSVARTMRARSWRRQHAASA